MKNKGLYIVVGALVVIGGLFAFYHFQPGRLDAFAQCLGDKQATFYGAFWCPHCQEQKRLFAKSADKLPYVECSTPDGRGRTAICEEMQIQSYPTWILASGERLSGVQTLQALAEKTGCTLPQ